MAKSAGKLAALQPLSPPKNMALALVERIATDIHGGKLAPGSRLPTEQEMMAAAGVSRTVVREAVAALRAEGLVITRQGVGAFVAPELERRPFRVDREGLRTLDEVLHVMELRTGVETESAGLAAERASAADLRRIASALAAFDRALSRDGEAVAEDVAFHHAIARATGNPQFTRFLEFLGSLIIPRRSVHVIAAGDEAQRRYLAEIQAEHRAIHAAIAAHDAEAARRAMRRHLGNGRERYRRLAGNAKRRSGAK